MNILSNVYKKYHFSVFIWIYSWNYSQQVRMFHLGTPIAWFGMVRVRGHFATFSSGLTLFGWNLSYYVGSFFSKKYLAGVIEFLVCALAMLQHIYIVHLAWCHCFVLKFEIYILLKWALPEIDIFVYLVYLLHERVQIYGQSPFDPVHFRT